MDLGFNITGTRRPETFRSVTGVIEALEPMGNRGSESCTLLAQLQTSQEGPVGLLITPDTYVVDYEPLSVGMTVTFWYRTDAPAPLIYPPRYYAAVAAAEREGRDGLRLLQRLLGLPSPRYHHHGLIRDADGGKLAKSRGSVALADLRAQGVAAVALRAGLCFPAA